MNILNKEVSNKWKGIAALGVVASHTLPVSTYSFLAYLTVGHLWVGIFFFLSGYGLSFSYRNKKNYLKGFLWSKIKRIYIPFVIAQILYLFAIRMAWNRLLLSIPKVFGLGLVNSVLWYILEILVLYILFWAEKKIIKRENDDIIWIFLIVSFIFVLVIIDAIFEIGPFWYVSSITFLIGYLFGNRMDRISCKIDKFIEKIKQIIIQKRVTCISGVVLTFLVYVRINLESLRVNPIFHYLGLSSIKSSYIFTFLQLIEVPLFLIVVLGVAEYTSEKRNILSFLGNISFEIYLVHMIWKKIFDSMLRSNPIVETLLIFIFTILSSCLYHLFLNLLFKKSKVSI